MSRRKADVTDSSLFVQNDMNVLVDWDSTRIAEVLTTETNVGEKVAKEIADEVSSIIKASGLATVTSSLVREIVDAKLIERGFESEVLKHQLIGFSPTEVGNIITQKNNENSNVPRGPEATNLVIAEAVKKRYYLNSVLDKDVAEAHMRGDIHIHDLGMPDRNYCGGNPIQYVGKYGLDLPTSISSAKPAKNAEVLLEQVVKFSASLQGCFAGAVGWDAVNMAIAPYIVGKSYAEIKQLAQILVFEFAQQAISRGGQSLGYDSPLILKDTEADTIRIIPIGQLYEEYDEGLWKDTYLTPSLNRETGKIEWKPVTGVIEHEPASPLHKIRLSGGRDVIVTEDHSLFSIDKNGDIIEATARDDVDTYLVSDIIPFESPTNRYSTEDAWVIGVMIGDGNVDSCVNPQAKLNTGSAEVAERMLVYLKDKFGYTGKIRQYKDTLYSLSCGRGAGEYFSSIGHGASNKQIPCDMLTESDEILYALLGGLFDSDGNISRGRYEYSTTSEALSNQIQFVLNRLGIRYGYRLRDSKSNFKRNFPVHTIQINSTDSAKIPLLSHTNRCVDGYKTKGTDYTKYDFGILRHKIRVEEGMALSQLPNSFRSLVSKIKRSDLEPLKDRLPWLSKYDYVLPYQVKSKERIDSTEKVYDISVKDNENFILANGIIAHNSVFSDLNLYWEIPDHYADVEAIGPGGKGTGKPYKDYLKESQAFVMALFDVYYEGDSKGRPFFFPKANVHITAKMFETEGHEEFLDKICSVASEKGNTYFIIDRGKTARISQCCRLTFDLSNDDLEEAKEPWRVRHSAIQNVTINMPRCAIEAEGDYDKFCANLDKNMRLAMKAHVTKKKYLRALLDMGEDGPLAVLTMNHDGEPYFRLDRGKALLGVVGLSETIRVLTGEEFGDTPASTKYGLKILSYMNQKCKEYSEEFGIHTILEQTPAETTAYRFAKMDRAKYPQYEYLFKGDHESGGVYYTNSSYVPVESDISPIERIKLEGKTHPLITAGSITHIWVGENKPSPEGIKALVKKVYEHTTCSQFDITPEFTTCLDCDRTARGLVKKCPHCGSEHVEGITRVTGYMSKIKQWNKGKIAELKDRVRHVVA